MLEYAPPLIAGQGGDGRENGDRPAADLFNREGSLPRAPKPELAARRGRQVINMHGPPGHWQLAMESAIHVWPKMSGESFSWPDRRMH
jgi:hypothetical protein